MRKYLIGLILGVLLTASVTTYADDIKSLIGEKIQGEFPVTVKGEQIDKKAIVVNGTSYLPVRALGDALDLDILYDVDLGVEVKEKSNQTVTDSVYEINSVEYFVEQLNVHKKFIDSLEARKAALQ